MTTIVGYADGARVILAADGRQTSGNEILADTAVKIIRRPVGGPGSEEHLLVATSGAASLGDVAAGMDLPVFGSAAHGAAAFGARLVKACQDSPLRPVDSDGHLDGNVLLGVRGTLWLICGNGHADPCARGFQAVGSGASYALGSMFRSLAAGEDPLLAVQDAIACASVYDICTGGQITVMVEERLHDDERGGAR